MITLGSGTMLLTGSNSYTGGTTISGGTLQIDDGTQNFGSGYSGSIVGNVVNKGTLAFSRIDNVTFPGNISGSGALVQLGDQGNQGGVGTLILAGSNTYSGGTTVSSGTLQIGNGGATGSITGNVTIDDSTYSGIYTSPPVLAFSRSDNVVFNGAITDINGTGTVVQVGPGKLTLTGSSNYGSNNTFANGGNGGTQVSGGTLQIGNGGNTGSITNDVYLSNNGTLAFSHSDNVVFAGTIMDDGLEEPAWCNWAPGC